MVTRAKSQIAQLQVENKINPWMSQAIVLLEYKKRAMHSTMIHVFVEEITLLVLSILIRVQVSLHQSRTVEYYCFVETLHLE